MGRGAKTVEVTHEVDSARQIFRPKKALVYYLQPLRRADSLVMEVCGCTTSAPTKTSSRTPCLDCKLDVSDLDVP